MVRLKARTIGASAIKFESTRPEPTGDSSNKCTITLFRSDMGTCNQPRVCSAGLSREVLLHTLLGHDRLDLYLRY